MSDAKVELGRYLFYDKRLSFNQKQSCATCHQQSRAFTDGRARAVGSTGEVHPRSSMSLVNVAYLPALTWANPSLTQLEAQAVVPMFGDRPVELGMKGREDLLLARIEKVPEYQRLFSRRVPG
jgi:cytochrome c peroxidase